MSQKNGSRLSPELHASLLKSIPHLRAFAISLTGNVDQADDLVQEAIMRGLSNLDSFTPGTNLQAWLFTILRNQFHTSFRRRKREVEDPDGAMASLLSAAPEQHGHLDLIDLRAALAKLPVEQREVLLLVAAEGMSYEEAAQICGTKVGTVKSRVNRARARLAELLHVEDEEDLGTDRVLRAALSLRSTSNVATERAA
jgi:RNA polymerase sigma-70 factor (ECF subfamily)